MKINWKIFKAVFSSPPKIASFVTEKIFVPGIEPASMQIFIYQAKPLAFLVYRTAWKI